MTQMARPSPRDSDAPAATFDQTTTVEIVRGAGGDEDFDPARIYERDAPGVVTIRSVLGDDPTRPASARDSSSTGAARSPRTRTS